MLSSRSITGLLEKRINQNMECREGDENTVVSQAHASTISIHSSLLIPAIGPCINVGADRWCTVPRSSFIVHAEHAETALHSLK